MTKDVFPKLATKATWSVLDTFEKSGLLVDGATETVKHEIKKIKKQISWGYDGTYGCFIDSTYGFFIDTTCGFFIDKC